MEYFTENDKSLLKQMIHAGRFNGPIYDLLCAYNYQKSQEMIKEMGEKWCAHPKHAAQKLDKPLPLLDNAKFESRILKGKNNG